jgi:predicted ATPase
MASVLWSLGYPDQALKRSQEALSLAQEIAHPVSLGLALIIASTLHGSRREAQLAQERAEAAITLSTEQGLSYWLVAGMTARGWALAEQGHAEEGIAQIRQSLSTLKAAGTELSRPSYLCLLAEAHGKVGQIQEGLSLVAEALDIVNKTEERIREAELYRIKGMLTLQSKTSLKHVQDKSQASQCKSEVLNTQCLAPSTQAKAEAEAFFYKAIEIACKQQAKSLELRAATSLARLWQQQDKRKEAYEMLAEIYGWFTEGFDTKDLQEAKALLEELS